MANATRNFVDCRVSIKVGDITREDVDAVVNAANGSLMGGGGVDGAIHRAGGAAILEECKAIRSSRYPKGLPVGEAVMTTAGRMTARHVLHTVGPVYGTVGAEANLAKCYRSCLALAANHGFATISFPAISTGVFGYPREEAAVVSSRAIQNHLDESRRIDQIRLVFSAADDAEVFLRHQVFS